MRHSVKQRVGSQRAGHEPTQLVLEWNSSCTPVKLKEIVASTETHRQQGISGKGSQLGIGNFLFLTTPSVHVAVGAPVQASVRE